jgi:hypothetical protein
VTEPEARQYRLDLNREFMLDFEVCASLCAEGQIQLSAQKCRQPAPPSSEAPRRIHAGGLPNGSMATSTRLPLTSCRHVACIRPFTNRTGEIQPCGR